MSGPLPLQVPLGLTKRHGPVPVLIVSGGGEIRAGGDELDVNFLPKPFGIDELIAIVRELTEDASAAGTHAGLRLSEASERRRGWLSFRRPTNITRHRPA